MAISRSKKQDIVSTVSSELENSKVVVYAKYQGLGVKDMQELRRTARETGTTVLVAKNRLVRLALSKNDALKNADTSSLKGQLLYAFNPDDEVAPAQVLHTFAKTHPAIKLHGAIDDQGSVMDEAQVTQLANLPSKDQLRGQLVGTIAAPLSGFINVLSGNMRGLVTVLNAHKNNVEKA